LIGCAEIRTKKPFYIAISQLRFHNCDFTIAISQLRFHNCDFTIEFSKQGVFLLFRLAGLEKFFSGPGRSRKIFLWPWWVSKNFSLALVGLEKFFSGPGGSRKIFLWPW